MCNALFPFLSVCFSFVATDALVRHCLHYNAAIIILSTYTYVPIQYLIKVTMTSKATKALQGRMTYLFIVGFLKAPYSF